MKFLLVTILALAAMPVFAQKQNVYFIKKDGTYVTNRDSAEFIRIVREPDSASTLYNVLEFYPNGTRKLVGKSSKIDPPFYQGACLTFYPDGKRKYLENYKNNTLAGPLYSYFPNGKLYSEVNYAELPPAKYFENEDDYTYVNECDTLGAFIMKDGNGIHREYDLKFKSLTLEGTVKDGKPDGLWKGIDHGMHLRYEETYKNGILVSGVSIGDKGDTAKYSKARMTYPHFKGGINAFGNYLGRNIAYPDFEKKHNIEGKVLLSFVVNSNGKVTDIKVLNSVSPNIDYEATRVIEESKAWVPATRYGRYIRVTYTVPVNFSLN